MLQAQGELPAARSMLERCLAIEAKLYGTRDHFSTAITEVNLAMLVLSSEQDREEVQGAIQLLHHAHQVFVARLGPDHPNTQRVSGILRQLGGDDEAGDGETTT